MLNSKLGTTYTRTPASGAGADIKGDLQPMPFSKPSILDLFFHEVKFCNNLNIHATLEKATEQAKDSIPYVAWKKTNKGWVVILGGETFIGLLKAISIYKKRKTK